MQTLLAYSVVQCLSIVRLQLFHCLFPKQIIEKFRWRRHYPWNLTFKKQIYYWTINF